MSTKTPHNQLETLRKKVEATDKKLLNLLKTRFSLTSKIQKIKLRLNLALFQKNREKMLQKMYHRLAKTHKLPAELIKSLFQLIFSYSKKTGIIRRWNNRPKNQLK